MRSAWTLCLLLALLVSACATVPLTEDELYERAARRAQEEDDIRELDRLCSLSNDTVMLYQRPTPNARCRMQNRRWNAPMCIPRHARLRDYSCVYRKDLERELRRLGL